MDPRAEAGKIRVGHHHANSVINFMLAPQGGGGVFELIRRPMLQTGKVRSKARSGNECRGSCGDLLLLRSYQRITV